MCSLPEAFTAWAKKSILIIPIRPHPESSKFPPRYKFSVFCGPLASLANFRPLISQSSENYTMFEVCLAVGTSLFTYHASQLFELLDLQDGSLLY